MILQLLASFVVEDLNIPSLEAFLLTSFSTTYSPINVRRYHRLRQAEEGGQGLQC